VQDNRDLFGFDRHRRNHSGSSSLGPAAIRDELKYIHDDDEVIVKVCDSSFYKSFLPPDAMRCRGICYGDVAVCLSRYVAGCTSVALMYCAQTTSSIIMRPLQDCSTAILVLFYKHEADSSRGSPLLRASNGRGVGKSRKIRPINGSHSPEGGVGRFDSDS